MNDVSESLAGRVGILELNALSNREIEKKQDELFLPDYQKLKKREKLYRIEIDKLYSKILKGNYPELYSNDKIEPKDFFQHIINSGKYGTSIFVTTILKS